MRSSHALIALLALLASQNLTLAQEQPAPEEQQFLEPEDATSLPEAEPADLLEAAPAPPASDVAATGEPAVTVNPNPLSSLTLEKLSATLSAPLFTPSRTAPAVEAPIEDTAPLPEPEVATEEPPPPLRLVGIVMTDATRTAVLVDQGTNEVHRLVSGEEYEGWSLTVVDALSIEFRSGDRVEALKMFESFPSPASYSVPEDVPIDEMPPDEQGQSGMQGQEPPDDLLDSIEQAPDDPSVSMPPEEVPLEDSQLQEMPLEEMPLEEPLVETAPPANFEPKLNDALIPEEGLPPEGDANAQ